MFETSSRRKPKEWIHPYTTININCKKKKMEQPIESNTLRSCCMQFFCYVVYKFTLNFISFFLAQIFSGILGHYSCIKINFFFFFYFCNQKHNQCRDMENMQNNCIQKTCQVGTPSFVDPLTNVYLNVRRQN